MNPAFVDTSALLAIAFGEAGGASTIQRLATFDALHASDLVVAELWSAFKRERRDVDLSLIAPLHVVIPGRSLGAEISRVLEAGYVRGADCWHLATALYLASDPSELTFITLDERQGAVAKALGFTT